MSRAGTATGCRSSIASTRNSGPRRPGWTRSTCAAAAASYAEKFIGVQRKEFRRLGVFWDWRSTPRKRRTNAPSRKAIYRTMDRSYEARSCVRWAGFFTNGSIYHGVKPVHWCWSCKTALAEAEVEYADRTDPVDLRPLPAVRQCRVRVSPHWRIAKVALLIWTTTPWTLPANLAVALTPNLDYVAVEVGRRGLIVAEGLLASVAETCGWDVAEVQWRDSRARTRRRRRRLGRRRRYPIERPYLAPSGAAAEPGVLILGRSRHARGRNRLRPHRARSRRGRFQRRATLWARRVQPGRRRRAACRGQGQPRRGWPESSSSTPTAPILADWTERGWLLHSEDHRTATRTAGAARTPCCSVRRRSGSSRWMPTGLRRKSAGADPQDPLDAGVRRGSHRADDRNPPGLVHLAPAHLGRARPGGRLRHCFDEHDDAFVRDAAFFDHLEKRLFAAEGSNAWFGAPNGNGGHRPYDLRRRTARAVDPGGWLSALQVRRATWLRSTNHIVDVWFESGASHGAVLGHDARAPLARRPVPRRVTTSTAAGFTRRCWSRSTIASRRRTAQVLTHGFTVDGDGRKMSKSLGNYVSPLELADNAGAEILRLWVSMIDFLEDMRVSEETLERNVETYRKVRNTFRYLLGNLHELRPATDAGALRRNGRDRPLGVAATGATPATLIAGL